MSADPALVEAVLAALADSDEGVSLPRLCKRLGIRMSVLLRTLAWIGEARVGGIEGEGLVRITRAGDREIAMLTTRGCERASGGTAPS